MPIEHPLPAPSTVKELYANALTCAFPGCGKPLFKVADGNAKRSRNSIIAHICARRENGPRWDLHMSAEENRSSANLILMCLEHGSEIDLMEKVADYPADVLREWKAQQLAAYDRAVGGGWELTDDEAAEVLEASEGLAIILQADVINLGGTGGNAPGAAGGGGGAIGPGAIGGPGGSVGRISLEGTPGRASGAGGGGGGVLLPGSIQPDPHTGTEGEGYSAGLDGQDGGDSMISIDDEVILRAEGGKGGLAGSGVRSTTASLTVSTLLLADYVYLHATGLASLVNAGWQSYSILNAGDPVGLAMYIAFEAGGVEVGEYTIVAEVSNPQGVEVARQSFPVAVTKPGDILRIPRWLHMSFAANPFGVWRLRLKHADVELTHLDFKIKRVGEAERD